ncbi:MAG: DHH family phosphoesterase, partial [Clostridia bacterium]
LQLDGFSPVFARLLEARGVTTAEAAQAFLHPHLSQLHDPFALSGMAEAVRILEIALQAGTPMVLYGDYDVDGVCGVSILYEYLQARGAQVAYYIPARHGEGYGLNRGAVEKLAQTARLLITVDCGMTNVEEVALAHTLGMQVIVTDHHEIPDPYPQCEAVINPLLGAYPFRRLCGAGVAWKLVCAMGGLEAAEPLLELAALATVADLVPLLDENRVLVSAGLAAMQHTTRPGLRALLAVSGLEGKMITAGHLGFQLGPRINAGGRLAHAGRSVVMMTTRDAAQAQEIAEALQAENVCRQQLEQAILRQADAWTQTNMDFQKERA